VLKEDVGIDHIKREANATHTFQNIVIHYGCKLLRPNLAAEFGPPNSGSFFEQLVTAAGATVVPWGLEEDCCGSSISTTDQDMANRISHVKMIAAQRGGADGVVVACPFCMLQLRKAASDKDGVVAVPSVSQLLCLALGLDGRIAKEQLDWKAMKSSRLNFQPCREGQAD